MSVKLMTTEQIHNDIAHTNKMWAGGIPMEQVDRLNALKAELKRRGAVAQESQPEMPTLRAADSLSNEQLTAELASTADIIRKSPSNEGAHERFADLRFEMRKRGVQDEVPKAAAFDPVTKVTDMAAAAVPNRFASFEEGTVVRRTTEMPRRDPAIEDARMEASKADFLAAQTRNIQSMEKAVRKYNIAKLALDFASQAIIAQADGIDEVDGDLIEQACTLGVKVAETICAKVGL